MNVVMKKVTYFHKPNYEAIEVLLHFHGQFPKNCIMHKDATLPKRLWPNASFVIRCDTSDIKTVEYFHKWYSDRKFRLVSDEEPILHIMNIHNFSAIYAHYILTCAMRPQLGKPVVDFQQLLYASRVPLYIFFNDENIEPFKFIGDYIKQYRVRNGKNILPENPYLVKTFKSVDPKRRDFQNVHLMVNENRVTDWGETCYKEYTQEHQFNICYLNDSILYDFPEKKTVLETGSKPHKFEHGVFIAFFLKERVELLNRLFDYGTDIMLSFMGKHSEKLLPRWKNEMTGELIENELVPKILQSHSWTIYIGKACCSKYLGATFYEPLFYGLPVFVWIGTDPDKRIFPDLDCYWKDERDLYELVKRTDLKQMWNQQINRIYEDTSI